MAKLRFEECENCKDWNGNRLHCANICEKPYEAWDEFNRLKDLEEQGLLLKLPCKVGDVVHLVDSSLKTIHLFAVKEITTNGYETLLRIGYIGEKHQFRFWEIRTELSNLGKWFFLTKSEAEAALERMGE